jgi:hypothetical protein
MVFSTASWTCEPFISLLPGLFIQFLETGVGQVALRWEAADASMASPPISSAASRVAVLINSIRAITSWKSRAAISACSRVALLISSTLAMAWRDASVLSAEDCSAADIAFTTASWPGERLHGAVSFTLWETAR